MPVGFSNGRYCGNERCSCRLPATKRCRGKIKKKDEEMVIQLAKTRDILKSLGEIKQANQLLVGFALETQNEREYALEK